jgi:hypothetical protein
MWDGAGVAEELRRGSRGESDYTGECADEQPARCGARHLIGHRPRPLPGYAIPDSQAPTACLVSGGRGSETTVGPTLLTSVVQAAASSDRGDSQTKGRGTAEAASAGPVKQNQNDVEFDVGAYQTAYMLGWDGPAFVTVACTAENIASLNS